MIINEVSVFLPRTREQRPVETARELIEGLDVGRAVVGEDLLTGGVTIRLPYDPNLVASVRAFFAKWDSTYEYEIELR